MDTPLLREHYTTTVVPELKKLRGYGNPHEVPKVTKVILNSGLKATLDKGAINDIQRDISAIAGQHAVITRAKKSISNFKVRQGMPLGVKVTLRGARMWEFLYRFLNIALPVIRDFRGVHGKLDGAGNYTLGISDHTIFPEINSEGGGQAIGLDVVIVTSAETDAEGRELLRLLGMPFRKREGEAAAAPETAPAQAAPAGTPAP